MSEFSRPVRIDTIGSAARVIAIEAEAGERAALARRFGIESLSALSATASTELRGGEVRATGRLRAVIVQACVATNAAMPSALDVPFSIIFRSELPADVPDAGIELSEDECDVVFYEGGAVDLGEAVAETLALAIDPYARVPDADVVLRAAGVVSEEDARIASGPFAGLAELKRD